MNIKDTGNPKNTNLQENQNNQSQVKPPQVNEHSTHSYSEYAAKDPVSARSGTAKSERNRPDESRPDNDSASDPANDSKPHLDSDTDNGLSQVQQQFVLRFCRQLASVIAACEQSESAEIEVGRRHIGANQIKVKLQAEREYSDKN